MQMKLSISSCVSIFEGLYESNPKFYANLKERETIA